MNLIAEMKENIAKLVGQALENAVAAGVLSPETLDKAVNGEATIDFDEILPNLIGAQIVFKVRHGKYKDKDTGETKDTIYTDVFNVNAPEVADIPKDANALKSLVSDKPAKQSVNF